MEYSKTINFQPVKVNSKTVSSITVTLPTAVQFAKFMEAGKNKSDMDAMFELVSECSGETPLTIKNLWFFVVQDAFSFLTQAPGTSSEKATKTSSETGES